MTYTTTDEVDDNMGGVVGGAMGALNPVSKEADTHAELYYNAVRNRKDGDVKKIARNAGLPESVVADVKRHVFFATDHDLGGGRIGGFEPDYMIAQAWLTQKEER